MTKIFLIAMLALGVVDSASAAGFSFSRPIRLTHARNLVGGVAIGDANGDGRMDLVVTEDVTSDVHQLSLFVQRADGSLAAPVKLMLPSGFGFAMPVTFVDLDRNGAQEIIVGGYPELIVVRLSSGALSSVSHPQTMGCSYLAGGDIDSDGNMDIVCHSGLGNPGYADLFYGDGAGGFRSTTRLQTQAGSWGSYPDFKSLRLADVTGDGRLDLLVTASRVDKFFVYPNNGLGGFFATGIGYAHPWSPTGVWPAALEVLDLDGDGVNEVVTASPDNRPDAALNVFRRGANGPLALYERIPIYDSTTALLAADVDGDGDKEAVAGHWGFNAVSLLGAGTGGVASQTRYDLPGFGNGVIVHPWVGHSHALALGDLNGDGCNDLVGATYSGVTLLYGCRPFVNKIPVSDFDGDGVADLYWRREVTGENYLWQWADLEAWRSCALPCPTLWAPPWEAQAVGDFDADGNSDVFLRNRTTGANQVMLQAFYARALTGVTSQNWQVVGAGDFDGDDRSDLLWRNSSTGANAIWRSGNNATPQAMTAVTNLAWKIQGIGDFNGDGKSDLVWRNTSNGANAIWRSGKSATPQAMNGVTNLAWIIAGVGDFDRDGRDDIAWRNTSTGANVIWRSGNNTTPIAVTGVTNLDWKIAAVADYNGDKRSDLMWRNGTSGANTIWLSGNNAWQQAVATWPTDMLLLR